MRTYLAAVVGSREEGDELPLGKELEAVLDDLVRAAEEGMEGVMSAR
jgi:hypothetical protein